MAVRPCTVADVLAFELRPTGVAVEDVYDWRTEWAEGLADGWFFVYAPQGTALAILGAWELHPGVCEISVLVSERIGAAALGFMRACRRVMDWLQAEHGIWRAQAKVRCDSERDLRFARAFGLEIESRMCYYGPDRSDYYLLARFWEVPDEQTP